MDDDTDADPTRGVWPEHVVALCMFLSIATQWRHGGGMAGGAVTGLDYAAARAGLEMAGHEITPGRWRAVQLIEAGALAAVREDVAR